MEGTPPTFQPPPGAPPPGAPPPTADDYPVRFDVEYPDRQLDRVSSALRIFWVIPILIVLATVAGGDYRFGGDNRAITFAGAGGLLFAGPLLMILFRQKYPRWWFDWNLELQRFSNRVYAYVLLMDDRYPSTDEHQSVRLEYPYPDVPRDLSRGMPLVKWFLAIPHYVVLFFLHVGAFFMAIAAWFAVVFTGRYPRGIFDYLVGVLRWDNRVVGYAFTLVTDRYPPFRLRP
jgi:hypothetical protein